MEKNVKVSEEKEVVQEGLEYLAYELKDDLIKSIDTATKVRNQQSELAKLLTESGKEEFKPLIEGLTNEVANIDSQIERMSYKLKLTEDMIIVFEDKDNTLVSQVAKSIWTNTALIFNLNKPE